MQNCWVDFPQNIMRYDVVEAHATATDFLWGIWAIRVASKKLIVERFDREGLHQLQNDTPEKIFKDL